MAKPRLTDRPRRTTCNVRGDSVIDGLRIERDVAQLLCEQACKDARNKLGQGNVAELARYYIRVGLGATAAQANALEEGGGILSSSGLAGLGLDAWTKTALVREVGRRGIGKAAIARHFIRRGLGMSELESMKREAGFAAIVQARQGLHGVFHGAMGDE